MSPIRCGPFAEPIIYLSTPPHVSRHLTLSFLCSLLLFSVVNAATTYDVGPGLTRTKLSDVSWGALKPGDIVNVHSKPGGYHEIIQVSAAGTAAQPILIRGIPDPLTGALPIIDGDGAVMDPGVDFRSTGTNANGVPNSLFEEWGVVIVTPRKTGYVYGVTYPEYITIETLDIRNAFYDKTGAKHFTDQRGAQRIYDPFACGIYVEFARHLIIRGCEISFNGNGIFANSKNGAAQSSVDILIEKNYIHDNGQPVINNEIASNGQTYYSNGFHEHNIYVEALGAVYQYNRFGPLRSGCFGCVIKDRSSGTIIRYNEVTSADASMIFWILDPQGGAGYIELQPDYRDAFVYGNVITFLPTTQTSGNIVAAYGAYNGVSSYASEHRGTLYFYHNTVVSHQSIAAFSLTDPVYSGSATILEKVECRNNIFYTDSAFQTYYYAFQLMQGGGMTTMNLGVNWFSPGSRYDWGGHPWTGGVINGATNLVNLAGPLTAGAVNGSGLNIVGDATGSNNPGFVNLAGGDFHLTASANSVDAGGALNAAVVGGGFLVTEQYLSPQTHTARVSTGAAADLGAFERSGISTAPLFTTQPSSQAAFVGSVVTLTAAVSSSSAVTYQWQKDGVNVSGATSPILSLSSVQLSQAGSYALIATNSGGATTSAFARLVVLVSSSNAISYSTTVSSTGVTVGGTVNFSYFLTNIGTRTWGVNHYLSIRDANNTFVAFAPLVGILPGEVTTTNLSFPAPTVAGSYMYYVQALENGVEFFSTQTTITLTVLVPLVNSITYNTTTFPVQAEPGSVIVFNYNVTNTGTQAWNASHTLSLKSSAGTTLASTPLSGLAIGASKTVNLSLTAPSTPGTYAYVVQAAQTGAGNFGTQANLTLVVLAPRPNAIVYNRIRYPDAVVPGAVLHLKYTLSNSGTQAWGAAHFVSLRDSSSSYLSFIPLSGTATGGMNTVEFTFTAPTTPGTYTYYVQALEDGIEFFSTQDIVIVTVVALPLANAISYNTSTIPITALPGAAVNFTANVTNRSTRTWGAAHYLSFRDVDNVFLAFPSLNGVVPGGSRTVNLSFVAPTTPGIYTYTLQAFEDGVSFFEMADTVVLWVQ